MPRRFLIALADHVMSKDGDESRTEGSPGHDVKDQIRHQKGLQESVRSDTRAKDIRKYTRAHQTEDATGDEGARQHHGCPADTRFLNHAGILQRLPGGLESIINTPRQSSGAMLRN